MPAESCHPQRRIERLHPRAPAFAEARERVAGVIRLVGTTSQWRSFTAELANARRARRHRRKWLVLRHPDEDRDLFPRGARQLSIEPNFSTISGAVNWITSSTPGSTSAVDGAAEATDRRRFEGEETWQAEALDPCLLEKARKRRAFSPARCLGQQPTSGKHQAQPLRFAF
jgi:hypothetical protein